MPKNQSNFSRSAILSALAIIIIAANLRSPITSVSPILNEIKQVLFLDNFQASMLTSIPLIVFAAFSILVSRAAARVQIGLGLIASMVILIAGLLLRVSGTVAMLYAGSFLVGLGICIGNVLTPAYVKQSFPSKLGLMTGVFSVSMNLAAAFASGLSISIGKATGLGWRGSLGIWVITAIIGLVIVLFSFSTKSQAAKASFVASTEPEKKFNIYRSVQAWNISIFMGLQSMAYYCLVAFLPTMLGDFGLDKVAAGWMFFALQMSMLPVMLLSPMIAAKMKNPTVLTVLTGATYIIGVAILLIFKAKFLILAVIILGIAAGLAFSLSMLFFSIRTKTMSGTIKMSGKAQSVGYLIAAAGPPIFGKLHDADPSWSYSMYFLLALSALIMLFGSRAARPRFVEDH